MIYNFNMHIHHDFTKQNKKQQRVVSLPLTRVCFVLDKNLPLCKDVLLPDRKNRGQPLMCFIIRRSWVRNLPGPAYSVLEQGVLFSRCFTSTRLSCEWKVVRVIHRVPIGGIVVYSEYTIGQRNI